MISPELFPFQSYISKKIGKDKNKPNEEEKEREYIRGSSPRVYIAVRSQFTCCYVTAIEHQENKASWVFTPGASGLFFFGLCKNEMLYIDFQGKQGLTICYIGLT